MYRLGDMYDYGAVQDYSKAMEWYQKAADAGHTDAAKRLSELTGK